MDRSIDGKLSRGAGAKQSDAAVKTTGAIDLEERREHRRRPARGTRSTARWKSPGRPSGAAD